MRKAIVCLAVFLAGMSSQVLGQTTPQSQISTKAQPLTNKDVEDMLDGGLGADVVVAKIKSSPCNFDTSPEALKELKTKNVPDPVILAMVQAVPAAPATASTTAEPENSVGDASGGKPRVYVSDSESWLVSGGFGASNGTAAGAMKGGSSPQTVEIIKTFQQRCPEVVVTNDRSKASYAILFDRESFKGALAHRDKIAVFKKDGDSIFSDSTRSVGNSVKDACAAIMKDSGPKVSQTN